MISWKFKPSFARRTIWDFISNTWQARWNVSPKPTEFIVFLHQAFQKRCSTNSVFDPELWFKNNNKKNPDQLIQLTRSVQRVRFECRLCTSKASVNGTQISCFTMATNNKTQIGDASLHVNGVAIAAAKDQDFRMFHLDVTCHLHSLCRTIWLHRNG